MSGLKKNKIIILKATKYSEADLIIHGLSPEGAKLSLLARGALKSKRRFSGGILEPTHYVEIQYRESSRSGGLAVIDDAVMINAFDQLRTDYDRLNLALFVVEVADRASQEGEVHSQGLFNLIGNSLKALEQIKDLPVFRLHFSLRFLQQQGVLIQEPWMKPFLAVSIADSNQLSSSDLPAVASWVDHEVQRYLHHPH